MSGHTLISPSMADRLVQCPAHLLATKDMPSTTSPAAEEGTLAHEEAAACLIEGKDPQKYEVADYVDYCRYMQTRGDDWTVETVFDIPLIWVESEGVKQSRGTADFCSHADAVLEIVDLKYGQGVYVSPTSYQFVMYAVGCMGSLLPTPPKMVKCTVVQPRWRDELDRIRSVEYTIDELMAKFQDVLLAAAKAFDTKNPQWGTGPYCQFCKLNGICEYQKTQATRELMEAFDGVSLEDNKVVLPEASSVPIETLCKVLDSKSLLDDWMKAAENRIFEAAQAGHPTPGWKIVRKNKQRAWVDVEAAQKQLIAILGENGAFEHNLLSPAKAEKAIKDKSKLPAIHKPEGELILAKEDDKREGVNLQLEVGKAFLTDLL